MCWVILTVVGVMAGVWWRLAGGDMAGFPSRTGITITDNFHLMKASKVSSCCVHFKKFYWEFIASKILADYDIAKCYNHWSRRLQRS